MYALSHFVSWSWTVATASSLVHGILASINIYVHAGTWLDRHSVCDWPQSWEHSCCAHSRDKWASIIGLHTHTHTRTSGYMLFIITKHEWSLLGLNIVPHQRTKFTHFSPLTLIEIRRETVDSLRLYLSYNGSRTLVWGDSIPLVWVALRIHIKKGWADLHMTPQAWFKWH